MGRCALTHSEHPIADLPLSQERSQNHPLGTILPQLLITKDIPCFSTTPGENYLAGYCNYRYLPCLSILRTRCALRSLPSSLPRLHRDKSIPPIAAGGCVSYSCIGLAGAAKRECTGRDVAEFMTAGRC